MRNHLRLLRPWFWLPVVGPAIAGYLLAAESFSWQVITAILFLAGPAIAGLAEGANELADSRLDRVFFEQRAFGINSSGNTGVARGNKRFEKSAWISLAVIAFAGLLVSAAISLPLLAVVILSQVLAVAYSLPPLRIKSIPYGGILARIIGYGPLAFSLGVLATGGILDARLIIIGIGTGLIVGGFSSTADIADEQADRQNGISTLVTAFGSRNASRVFSVLILTGLLLLIIMSLDLSSTINQLALGLLLWLPWLALGAYAIKIILVQYENVRAMNGIHVVGLLIESTAPVAAALIMVR